MALNLDTRFYEFSRQFDADEIERLLRDRLPADHIVKIRGVNRFLGSGQQVSSEFLNYDYSLRVELTLSNKELVDRAQTHVKLIAPALGLPPLETPEFVPDPHVKKTDTGERIITLQQYHRGIPIFEMERTVWMAADGTVYNVIGTSVGLPDNLEVVPNVSVEQALVAAMTYLISSSRSRKETTKWRINVKNYKPRVLARTMLPSRPCVLEKKRLGEAVPAHLVFFYQGETTRLGWQFLISAPNIVEQYVVIVEARVEAKKEQFPQVLYSQNTSKSLTPVRGNVWINNPKVNNKLRQMVDFPRPKDIYPIDTLPNFPQTWIDGDGSRAAGNFSIVLNGIDQEPGDSPRGEVLHLDPTKPRGQDQKVLNAFFFCNFMHDFFYTLGFNEEAKNFQRVNPDGKGKGGDPVIVRLSDRFISGIAHLITLADGSQTLLDVSFDRNTENSGAIDADVIFHEYAHGVTNRLVGSECNPHPLVMPQSAGMGEGWSDYFALTIQNFYLTTEDRKVIGDWLIDDDLGLRKFMYIDSLAGESIGHFAAIGRQIAPGIFLEESHDIGRIWCGALMKMNRDLVGLLGKKEGHLLGWQIVIAGLQFTPANPNYLEGRDCIIQALKCRRRENRLNDDDFKRAYTAVWTAFTLFGMGALANSPSSGLADLHEDTDMANIPAPNLKPFDPL